MEAQVRKAKTQATIDLARHLEGVRQRLDAARARLVEIAEATDDEWQDVRQHADEAWKSLVGSVEGVLAALEPHTRRDAEPVMN